MSITKLHERLEKIERAYVVALDGRYPETVPDSIWRPAVLAAVPDCTTEDLIAMFNWRTRKLNKLWREFQKRPRLDQAPNWPKSLPDVSVDGSAAPE